MNYPAVIGAALASMLFAALSTAFKHRSAGDAPEVSFSVRRIGAFLAATVRHPFWLGAILADACALIMQVIALHYGALSVVQPMLALTILFALIFSHFISGVQLSGREMVIGFVLVAAVVGFLLISDSTNPNMKFSPAHHIRGTIASSLAILGVLGCLYLARGDNRSRRGAYLGAAVGLLYACTAVLIKACSDHFRHGPIHLLLSWELYAWIVCGACALILAQAAFQRGTLSAVVGATAAVDPLASIALGIAVYGEMLRTTSVALVGEAATLTILTVCVVLLSRTAADQAP